LGATIAREAEPNGLVFHQNVGEMTAPRKKMIEPQKPRTDLLAREDRYATLLSRCRTTEAQDLIRRVYRDIDDWQKRSGKRVRARRARSGHKFLDAIERFVGDLLRARASDTNASGRIYHAIGKTKFDDDPVSYDLFKGVLEGLEALGFVGHERGQTRFSKVPEWGVSETLPGRASRFWATSRLLKLAESFGIHEGNVTDHFKPEPPHRPLVLRDYATGKGVNRERGPIIKDYKRTKHTKALAADIRELNDFLAHCDIVGGEHEGYTRNFNNASWNKGGRLYSVGGGYQQLPEQRRLQMTINGEPVAEIDIKASYLTIFHAQLGSPLGAHEDPYVRAGVERKIAKSWIVHSFGKSRPQMRWPPKAIEDFKKETGQDLSKVAKASDVARKMLAAFPALRELERHEDIWADLQYIEAEAVIGTMLILMRTHGVPSLSMHDGLIVSRSQAELAKKVLSEQYQEFAGVTPILTVDVAEGDYVDATEL
jgi:hypothetical protein